VRPGQLAETDAEWLLGGPLARESRAAELLRRPEVTYEKLMRLPGIGPGESDPQVAEQVEIQAKYAGYIERQREEIERQRRQEHLSLPPTLDYAEVRGLSREVREKLERHRPQTLGQAGRIPGMTPAAISLLLVYLKRGRPAKTALGDG
jgi:tRNA uridine 5-carboxymethylaminomethyl modification enzyme